MYDPASGSWAPTSKRNNEGYGESAVVLPDDKVLVVGGTAFTPPNDYHDLDSAEVYDPVTDSWTPIANMHATSVACPSVSTCSGRATPRSVRYRCAYTP